jgi:WhiB family redox-sensing transcriptional regulator
MNDWMDRAACRDVDPELFFPVGTGVLAERQTSRAKAVCRRCPVRSECLRWAQHHSQDDGVWGGLDPDERRMVRREEVDQPRRLTAGDRVGHDRADC